MRAGFRTNDSGVSSTLEFMLSFIVAAAIFSLFVINLNSLIISPKDTVRYNQYIDVGNDISTKLIDTYLVAPENGYLNVSFDMPDQIIGDSFTVSINSSSYDREVRVSDLFGGKSVFMVLNGASSTIPINGTTNSTDQYHTIKYRYTGGGH